MFNELTLAILTATIPAIMYVATRVAIRIGPNPFIGFRFQDALRDVSVWRRLHQSLLPLLKKQLLLCLGVIPLTAALVFLPAAFPALFVIYLLLILTGVAISFRKALTFMKQF